MGSIASPTSMSFVEEFTSLLYNFSAGVHDDPHILHHDEHTFDQNDHAVDDHAIGEDYGGHHGNHHGNHHGDEGSGVNDGGHHHTHESSPGLITAIVLICITGLLGNSLVLFIFNRYKELQKTSSTHFIMTQAVVDVTGSVAILLQEAVLNNLRAILPDLQGPLVCRWVFSNLLVCIPLHWSTISLMGLTIHRYVKVVHPHSRPAAWRRPRVVLLLGVAAGAITGWDTVCLVQSTELQHHICLAMGVNQPLTQACIAVWGLLLFLLPMVLFAVCYTHIYLIINKTQENLARFSQDAEASCGAGGQGLQGSDNNLTATMVLVCVAYLVCWGPLYSYLLLRDVLHRVTHNKQLFSMLHLLAFTNSAVNPFIYTFKYRVFKQRLRGMFPSGAGRGNQVSSYVSTSGAHNTATNHTSL